jgi:hypothetical protein
LVGPVTIGRGDLTIVGCGRRSRIVSLRAGALVFDDVADVRLEDQWVFSGSLEPTVLFINSRTIEMVDCRIVNVGRAEIDAANSNVI